MTIGAGLAGLLFNATGASACGGLFCQNTPVNQSGERIVFSVNPDDTVTSLVQIQYFGEAEDFSWILPIPEAIEADDLQVPEEGDQVFTDLHALTDVQIFAPDTPGCATNFNFAGSDDDTAAVMEDGGVEIFASGEVGPFGFDVIGSSDPVALITWLRDNNYRVDPPMEPLINLYVDEEFAFVAMRLLQGETANSIAPIEITYPGTQPMIPLRLTAVAAQPDMPMWVWIFGQEQYVPQNFEHMEIATEELTFFNFGGNNYPALVSQRSDALGGQAFITEFAGPAASIFDGNRVVNSYLRDQAIDRPYLTRLSGVISPEEMLLDPVFVADGSRPDVSNVRDARGMKGLYECERDGGIIPELSSSDALFPIDDATGDVLAVTPPPPPDNVTRNRAILGLGLAAAAAGGGAALVRRQRTKQPTA